MPSSQSIAVPMRQPWVGSQVSAPSQLNPFSQYASFARYEQVPVPGSHESMVQLTRSSQTTGAPAVQMPESGTLGVSPSHVSTPLQRSPSWHSASSRQGGAGMQSSTGEQNSPPGQSEALGVDEQSCAISSHASTVQLTPSE